MKQQSLLGHLNYACSDLRHKKLWNINSWRVNEFWTHNTSFMLYFACSEPWLSYINAQGFCLVGFDLLVVFLMLFICLVVFFCALLVQTQKQEVNHTTVKFLENSMLFVCFPEYLSVNTVQTTILLEFNKNIQSW